MPQQTSARLAEQRKTGLRNGLALLLLVLSCALRGACTQPSPLRPHAGSRKLTHCGILNDRGASYLLERDISSPGTCFSIQADNITLNLNGHTITYNAADQEYAAYGIVGMPCWDPDLLQRRRDCPNCGESRGTPCGGSFSNFTVFGGTIAEGTGAAGDSSHCIRLGQGARSGPTIYSVTFNFHSKSAQGIHLDYQGTTNGGGAIIHDNLFNNSVKLIANRHQEDGVSIGIIGCGKTNFLTSHIYHNRITGGPQSAIRVDCPGAEIDHNVIKQGNPNGQQTDGFCDPTLGCQYSNDFAILAWGKNQNVHDNTIQPLEGRGIQLAGGATGVLAEKNTVSGSIEYKNNGEYKGCEGDGAYGIQWDDGPIRATATGNVVTVAADVCIASAMRLTDVPASGGSRSIKNSFAAVRRTGSQGCSPPWNNGGCAFGGSFDMTPGSSGFTSTDDTFIADTAIFWFDWLGAQNVTLINPTFNKGSNPSDPWYFAVFSNGGTLKGECGCVSNFHWRDATYGSGVDPAQGNIPPQNPGTINAISMYEDWTLTLTIERSSNDTRIRGALVTYSDAKSNHYTETTNGSGVATLVLTARRFHNDTGPNQVDNRNPFSFSISATGCKALTWSESITAKANETKKLAGC